VRKLVAKADIIVHNFRPGAPDRLGIGYDDVKALNPNAVYHYGASYGPDGPYAFKPAMHPSMGAVSGTAKVQLPPSILGTNDAELPLEQLKPLAWRYLGANEGNPDINAALAVGTAQMLGLQAREVSGSGQAQHTTMMCSSMYTRADDAIRYPGKPPSVEPDAMLYGTGPLYRLYRCAEGWVFLACPFQAEFEALARALGHEEWLADPRFATNVVRAANADALAGLLEGCFTTRGAEDWERALTAAGVACVRADGPDLAALALNDTALQEAAVVTRVHHRTRGDYVRLGPLMTIDGVGSTLGPACELGEHTRPIMRELGYGDIEIDALRDRKVVNCLGE
jgi:crotonobetainyl-CoA:carnitine CoA-transferase CaiB-like acyl-CoA transferase